MAMASENMKHQVSGLLSLPTELREEIYVYFFEDLVSPPWHPWDHLPSNARFRDYLSLILSNREVYHHCTELFRKRYANRTTFNFETASGIFNFREQAWCRFPQLSEARFALKMLNVDENDDRYPEKDAIDMIIDQQPGFQEYWLSEPGYFVTRPKPRDPSRLPRGSAGYNYYLANPEWDYKSSGFDRREGDHSACPPASSDCKHFVRLEFPKFDNSCQLITYSWGESPYQRHAWEKGPREPACMVLEGRLADINL
jgi:hypothetical protein